MLRFPLCHFSVKSMEQSVDAEQVDFTELDNALQHQKRFMSVPRALATEASIKRKQVIGETSLGILNI